MTQQAYASENRVLFTTNELENERRNLTAKLRGFIKLPRGWSHGRGLPISEISVVAAEEFLCLGIEFGLRADVFPNQEGGCAVAFYNDDSSVEVSIDAAGQRFRLTAEQGIGFQFEELIEPQEDSNRDDITSCLLGLQLINKPIWKLFGSSISANSTEPNDDSEMSSTTTPRNHQTPRLLQTVEGGSQSSRPLVPAMA